MEHILGIVNSYRNMFHFTKASEMFALEWELFCQKNNSIPNRSVYLNIIKVIPLKCIHLIKATQSYHTTIIQIIQMLIKRNVIINLNDLKV